MATSFPIVVTGTSPVTITSQMSTVSWSQINQSILSGAFRLKVNTIYLACQDISQLNNNFYFYRYSQSGAEKVNSDGVDISPFQYQSSAFWDLSKSGGYILDNLSRIDYTLNPNATVQMCFFADYVTNMDALQRTADINGIVIPDPSNSTVEELNGKEPIGTLTPNDYKEIMKGNKVSGVEVLAVAAIFGGLIYILKNVK